MREITVPLSVGELLLVGKLSLNKKEAERVCSAFFILIFGTKYAFIK